MKEDSFLKKLFGSKGAKIAKENLEAANEEKMKKKQSIPTAEDYAAAEATHEPDATSDRLAKKQRLEQSRTEVDQAFAKESTGDIQRGTKRFSEETAGETAEVGETEVEKVLYGEEDKYRPEKKDEAA